MEETSQGEFIPTEEKVKQISMANGVKEGTALSAWCLSLDLRPMWWGKQLQEGQFESQLLSQLINHIALVNLYASTTRHHYPTHLGPHAPRTKAAL